MATLNKEALTTQMENKRYNISRLSRDSKVHRVTIMRWLAGTHAPNIDSLMKVCAVLDIDPTKLLSQ